MALHDSRPGNLTWDEYVVGELGKVVSHLGDFVTWQTWTEPLHDISVILTLNIDCVNFILIEMSIVFFWNLNILSILAEVNLDGVISELVEELLDDSSLFVGNGADVLVGLGIGHTLVASVVRGGDWVETIEEGLEESIFGVLDDSENSGSLWLVVSLNESLTNGEGVLLLGIFSLLSDPDGDILVELEDEAIVGVEHLSGKWPLLDLSNLNLASLI